MVGRIVGTLQSTNQVLNEMHSIVGELNSRLREFNRAPNEIAKAKAEERIILSFDKLKLKCSKFEMSAINLIIKTAENLGELGQNYPVYHKQIENALEEIERLFKGIRESEKKEIKESRYFGRTAHHLMRRADHIGDDVNRFYKDFVKQHKQNRGN